MFRVITEVKTNRNRNYCCGFSLVEILIVIVLSLLLFEAVLQNYLTAKNIYRSQTEIAYLSENVRFADFILRQNIMHAGFVGCRKISELKLNNHTDIGFGVSNAIYGYDGGSYMPSYLSDRVVKNTDVIIVAKAGADTTNILNDVGGGAKSIIVEQNPATFGNKYLLISDCEKGDLFFAKNHEGNTISTKSSLAHDYKIARAEVSRFEELAFFISDTGRLDERKQPIYSLYSSVNPSSADNRGNKRELVPGVSDMQIYYGVDAKYLKAYEVDYSKSWSRVHSVIIELKMQNSLPLIKKICIRLRERNK